MSSESLVVRVIDQDSASIVASVSCRCLSLPVGMPVDIEVMYPDGRLVRYAPQQ